MSKAVAVMGGCMLTGLGQVPLPQLFYRVVKRRLWEEEGLLVRMRLENYGNFRHPDYVVPHAAETVMEEAADKAVRQLDKSLDALVCFVRPLVHWAYLKPWSYCEGKLYLHPVLGGSARPIAGYWPARVANKLFRCAFHWSGARWALYGQADRLVEAGLRRILELCQSRGVPFICISSPLSFHGPIYEARQEAFYRSLEAGSLNEVIWVHPKKPDAAWTLDGFHPNALGHACIARSLYDALLPILRPANPGPMPMPSTEKAG